MNEPDMSARPARFQANLNNWLKVALSFAILLMVMVAFAIKPEVVQRSVFSPYVTTGARVLVLAMPSGLKEQFRAGFDRFHQALMQVDKKAK